ncbi:hypothetical protein HM1_1157 [Heliomicrobium modesticaldum Ice1]|uniref:Uncharacterized protein n=1 Tax=Heliobacterium modesticaldum (strain ATCC 51547 / Ice1) TaxID=498761 RepID=B0THH9_HELMI|nr:hypothetical protein HM1_1157 [Heliomicrobium modesticaldum Ice1]
MAFGADGNSGTRNPEFPSGFHFTLPVKAAARRQAGSPVNLTIPYGQAA